MITEFHYLPSINKEVFCCFGLRCLPLCVTKKHACLHIEFCTLYARVCSTIFDIVNGKFRTHLTNSNKTKYH